MFFDLNIPIQDAEDVHSLNHRERLGMAIRLGFDAVATNLVLEGKPAEKDKCKLVPTDLRSILETVPSAAEALQLNQRLLKGSGQKEILKQMTRITIVLEDSTQAAQLNAAQAILATYDIVAVKPTSERTLQQACSMLDADIITMDFTRRLPFRLRPQLVKQALQRGLLFEVEYSGLLRSGTARRQLIGQAAALMKACGVGGVVLTSGALRAMELRGPYDVVNLASLFELNTNAAKAALASQCERVLAHGAARKTFKGIIQVVPLHMEEEAAGEGSGEEGMEVED
mmetsp:Transcript_40678/g.68105  ORF Transcript_40678/g.68105 Transcript_40678/m.68105 type:complete len:285 (+) Transcript_40678:246-1100(+)|eukprot:CAMPEP_0198203358 /NCGR_PEP_ID=MMETSP1445-20131203/6629_1 /TAXON_ID=36898 /ORGANISM="Pyramimonas sp., Strain CCMP2087" /LENGTH=284 /DNA_ID=CAMNT_0043874713 /DNA_START=238 /DNA_END=1092 /DNA_ORIENTATION=+